MQDTPVRRQAERSEATRSALIAAARRLFVEKGYTATGTPELVGAARVTRGALYHHFADKADLFMAVALQAADEVALAIATSTAGKRRQPVDELVKGAHAYFAAMAQHGRARLLLLDAPSILSASQIKRLSDAAGISELESGLAHLFAGQGKPPVPLAPLATILSAAFDQAALAIAQGASATQYEQATAWLLRAIAGYEDRSRIRT